jgi:hypothetical protein
MRNCKDDRPEMQSGQPFPSHKLPKAISQAELALHRTYLLVVPCNVRVETEKPGGLLLEEFERRLGVGSIDVPLLGQRESHSVVKLALGDNFVVVAGLLTSELV